MITIPSSIDRFFRSFQSGIGYSTPRSPICPRTTHVELYNIFNMFHLCNFPGDVFIHPTARVDPTAKLGPNVSIGSDCVIGPGARVKESIILDGADLRV